MVKECEKEIKPFESSITDFNTNQSKMPYLYRGESFTQGLVRVTSKIFHSTQYSCERELTRYIQDSGLNERPVYHRFAGNRFQICFVNAGLLYFYSDHINDFFSSIFSPKMPFTLLYLMH